MSRKPTRTRAEAWEDLQEQLANGKPVPVAKPTLLTLKLIKRWPEVFQHRAPGRAASEAHVRDLQKAIRQQKLLEPLLVWWDGRGWACIDGHHRLEAYRTTGAPESGIPVEAFEGTLEEAHREAAARNSQAKLQMVGREKLEAAWHIVVFDPKASRADTVRATGVGDGTVARMRRVRTTLADRGLSPDAMTWAEARVRAEGGQPGDPWDEDRIEKEAEKVTAKLLEAFGRRMQSQPEVLARALQLYSARLPALLVAEWGDLTDTDENEEEAL